MHVPISMMSDAEKALANDCSQLCFAFTATSDLLTLREETGLNWKAKQIRYLSQKEKALVNGLSKDVFVPCKYIQMNFLTNSYENMDVNVYISFYVKLHVKIVSLLHTKSRHQPLALLHPFRQIVNKQVYWWSNTNF